MEMGMVPGLDLDTYMVVGTPALFRTLNHSSLVM